MELNFISNNLENIVQKNNLQLIQEKEQIIPNAIQYNIKRYAKPLKWNKSNSGQLIYHYNQLKKNENFVELRFCVLMQDYCSEKKHNCDHCKLTTNLNCSEIVPTIDFVSISFSKNHLQNFYSNNQSNTLLENIIQFKQKESFSIKVDLTDKIIKGLQNILNHTYTGSFENIYFNAQTQMLLLYSFDNITGNNELNEFNCKFLATETERVKIQKARTILIENIGEPLTIKALSRKVAINECYLKKGFKELFGQTIFDFYQSQRMEHAKYLLYVKGLTVTDVSHKLGYSSISHFSTAFKKLTGLKPCELLLR